MNKLIILTLGITILFSTCSNEKPVDLILLNANVIDVKTGEIVIQNIAINKGKIVDLSNKSLNAKKLINLKEKYIIPGLWDMHTHIHKAPSMFLNELVNHGVLGIRQMGTLDENKIDSIIYFKNLSNLHTPYIPQMEISGFIHNGESCEVNEHKSIKTKDDIIEAIKYIKSINGTFFKIHNCFPSKLFNSLQEICNREGIKITGHIPEGLDPLKDISLSDISSIEHVSVIMRALLYKKNNPIRGITAAAKKLDSNYLDSLGSNLINNKIAFTPNLVSEENFINSYPEDKRSLGLALLNKYKQYTKRLSDQGVMILAGTDLGLEGLLPGDCLLRELELLVEAGLTPIKSIQTTTLNPSKYLYNEDQIIAKNRLANLVILNSNPLTDIKNIRDIKGIVSNGKLKTIQN